MIRIAIVGVGNCASSLIQGIQYHKSNKNKFKNEFSDYILNDISEIQVVAAFDIDDRKVGLDVSEAIFQLPNNTKIFCKDIPILGVTVQKGPTLDGFSQHLLNYNKDCRFVESNKKDCNVVEILKATKPDILINYLPVGSESASRFYADCCIEAGVNFINAVPVFICTDDHYIKKFKDKGLICMGDDIKSQLGATVLHRNLINLFEERGIRITNTYQLNTGGNTDFLNMLEVNRLKQKKISKTQSVESQIVNSKNYGIHIGPSDYVDWQKDNKVAFIRIEGMQMGEIPMTLELRLSVEDSPNSAAVMFDVIRLVKIALEHGVTGYVNEIAAYGFKYPKTQRSEKIVYQELKLLLTGFRTSN